MGPDQVGCAGRHQDRQSDRWPTEAAEDAHSADVSGCPLALADVSECQWMSAGVSGCQRMSAGVSECQLMSADVSGCQSGCQRMSARQPLQL